MQMEYNAFIIRPTEPLKVGRMERNPAKLEALYRQGYADAKNAMNKIKNWIGEG